MRTLMTGISGLLIGAGLVAGTGVVARGGAAQNAAVQSCGSASAPQLRTTLYFGLVRPKGGSVSELDWQIFLRDEVTSRFPQGLTVWEAEGQWKGADGAIGHERTKVLLLVHPDTAAARGSVQALMTRYRKTFDQESVLFETARVCAAT
jgi:Protein of unknown function (DUF3574)